jgi:hypothetical protein
MANGIIIDKPAGWTSMDVCPSPQNDGAFCGGPSQRFHFRSRK